MVDRYYTSIHEELPVVNDLDGYWNEMCKRYYAKMAQYEVKIWKETDDQFYGKGNRNKEASSYYSDKEASSYYS